MVKTSQNKKGIWFLVALIVILTVAIAVYLLVPRNVPSAQIVGDVSLKNTPDYAACQLITTNVIKSTALGSLVTGVQEGTRVGVDGLNGEKADACSFPFSTNSSTNNLLTVSVYTYSPTVEAAEQEFESTQWSEVSGPKPTPYFGKTTIDNGQTSLYMLRVVPGAQTILLSLRQPKDAAAFKEPDALNFLVGISTKINFGAYEKKVEEQAQGNGNYDGPPPPPENVPNVESQPIDAQ